MGMTPTLTLSAAPEPVLPDDPPDDPQAPAAATTAASATAAKTRRMSFLRLGCALCERKFTSRTLGCAPCHVNDSCRSRDEIESLMREPHHVQSLQRGLAVI